MNITIKYIIDQLNPAFEWLCQRRNHHDHNADVWDFRLNWVTERARLRGELRAGTFQFYPLRELTTPDDKMMLMFSARDVLLLRALTLALNPVLPLSPRCVHLRGNGGLKATVRDIHEQLPEYTFVLKTDVRSYYASIDQGILQEQLRSMIPNRAVWQLVGQALQRTSTRGGLYRDFSRGIPKGSPLNPLLGGVYLEPLDRLMEILQQRKGIFYVRYQDDILILTKTRWQLKEAVRTLNQTFNTLKLKKHPDKTFIGRIARGFDFLGYRFGDSGISGLTKQTPQRFLEKGIQLIEQAATPCRRNAYAQRWWRWTIAGLRSLGDQALNAIKADAHQSLLDFQTLPLTKQCPARYRAISNQPSRSPGLSVSV